tara:strand:+ start:1133 stop:1357 length:225 start_codon:yes stop_codon:yes gene_type:complete
MNFSKVSVNLGSSKMSEQTTFDREKYVPTEKQKDFLQKLLSDENLSKTDYSYIINFVNSIVFNNKKFREAKQNA